LNAKKLGKNKEEWEGVQGGKKLHRIVHVLNAMTFP